MINFPDKRYINPLVLEAYNEHEFLTRIYDTFEDACKASSVATHNCRRIEVPVHFEQLALGYTLVEFRLEEIVIKIKDSICITGFVFCPHLKNGVVQVKN
jgi:hypothetical protein